MIQVEVIYCAPGEEILERFELPPDSTVAQLLERVCTHEHFTSVEIGSDAVGIWGRSVNAQTVLQDGDRLEIYRPLVADPKSARRRRAAQQAQRSD